MKRRTFAAAVAGAVLAVGAALAPAQAQTPTLTLWTWRQQEIPLWEAVGKKLNVKINVETTRPTEYDARLRIAMQDKGPDIIQGRAGAGWIDPYVQAGAFAPVDGLANLGERFPVVALNLMKASDGKTYGVPFAFQTTHFMYNQAVFDKLGLKEPQTWDEFWQVLDTIKQKGGGIAPLGAPGREAWALNIAEGILDASLLGSDFVRELQAGDRCFTDPKYVENLRKLQRMSQYFQPGFAGNDTNDVLTSLALGQVAIVPYGIFGMTPIRNVDPTVKIGLFLAPADAGGKPAVFAYPDGGYYMNARTQQADTVKKVLAFTATEEFGQMFVDIVGEIPAVRGNFKAQKERPELQEALQFLNERPLEYLTWVRSPFRDGTPNLYDLQAAGLQQLYAGQTTPERLAKTIQDGLNTSYKPFMEKKKCS